MNYDFDIAPLTDVRRATPEWLTGVLRSSGHLPETVQVVEVTVDAERSQNASTARLRVTYAALQGGEFVPPTRLFLKLCDLSTAPFGDSEVRYYRVLTTGLEPSPAPRCYHAAYSEAAGRYHLLLEDLSVTHVPCWDIVPTLATAGPAVDALARLHARWWDTPGLPEAAGKMPTEAVIQRYVAAAEGGLTSMLAKAELSVEDRDLVHQVFDKHPPLMIRRARGGSAPHLTCIHGDPNPGNILVPREMGAEGKAYLIDRQLYDWSLSAWIGASDLAYMMVHWWPVQARRELQAALLDRYHQQLQAHGIPGYTLQDLWDDYRLSAMQSLYVAACWCADAAEREAFAWVWRPQLQKTLAALHDLQCTELLG